jgi:hypothetical protein
MDRTGLSESERVSWNRNYSPKHKKVHDDDDDDDDDDNDDDNS